MGKEKLLTPKELADIFSVEIRTIYKYVREGIPTFSKKPLRFIESQCRNWIKERR